MSVAFRREGDDEHLEPKFELPIPPGPNLVTPRGLALIEARVAEINEQIAALTDEEQIKKTRRELRYWSTRQSTARLMDAPDADTVAFGCTVTFILNGTTRSITIVGDDEADPAAGLLSFTAPLARALMDAEVGEKVDFGGKSDAIEVIAIVG
ncbi:transcription elongation GreA/GreB family factor [Novosphingobium hassiacum]|uniref:Transcription elongation GreA/GreB family factor n=1 Tax=Novosphingobium hassiacum TaxID=173676 RepID=A0A7W6EW89_9SPHN|nr:GreA/GreB family elongation factor [Novosphingobium hassiacum]MBB3860735.1 transcription elongation GreA/GreB family factor [Novosphingobium hassiacum]